MLFLNNNKIKTLEAIHFIVCFLLVITKIECFEKAKHGDFIFAFAGVKRAGQQDCGIPTIQPIVNRENRIINGYAANPNSWPWIVSLRYTNNSNFQHFCAGSLIASQYVLTSARCVRSLVSSSFVVVAGANNLDQRTSNNTYSVSTITVHPNFNSRLILNDVAIIKLNNPVTLSDKVSTICLPTTNVSEIYNQNVFVAGWGSTTGSNAVSSFSNTLLQAKLRVINYNSRTLCQGYDAVNYCARDSTTKYSNICFGDSGGPLMYFSDGRWYVYGVNSFIFANIFNRRCLNTYPSFYAIVPNYLTFINANVNFTTTESTTSNILTSTSTSTATSSNILTSDTTLSSIISSTITGSISSTTSTVTVTQLPTTTVTSTTVSSLTCGNPAIQPSINGNQLNRIINGDAATPYSWPWIVSLRSRARSSLPHICGGSLIGTQYVLTAAHCVSGSLISSIAVVVGTNFQNERTSANTYFVSKITVHQNYNSRSISNDIAILKLDRPVTLSDRVSTICLPSSNANTIYNKNVVVAGWGSTNGLNGLPNALLQAKLTIKNYNYGQSCQSRDAQNYCAVDTTAKSSNICYGDSGGPLMYFENGRWFLYGLSSFVLADPNTRVCLNTLPSFYAIVPNYISWINSNMK